MKIPPLKALQVILLTLLSFSFPAQSIFNVKAKKLIGTFSVYHYKPIVISEKTSAEIVDLFIENLDSKGMFLTKGDVNLLTADKDKFLSKIQSGEEDYTSRALPVYLSALRNFDSVLTSLTTKTLNFNASDTLFFFPLTTKAFYSPDLKYHAKRIERYVKTRSYDRVINLEGYEKFTEKEFNQKAQEFSKTIIENLKENVSDLKVNAYSTIETRLLHAIALRHDPHSAYFNHEQNTEFNKALSSTEESFGLYFDQDQDGNIIIGYIEPGGSAWQSNEVNEGDIFISVKIGPGVYTSDGNSADDIQEKLEKTNEKKIKLTVKKANGTLKHITLLKQKIASTENSVKGYVLKNSNQKVGYISLPSFYTDMEDGHLPGCANDVAKEILKLQEDSISGLIIDLRNNGGGSMREAMDLAGIFVDEGPLFILKEKTRKPYLMKDINRGSIFKKPLVVMINETSASASELFSNIVKDYHLGLVVGQTSYGKGTAQNVIPLDTTILSSKTAMQMNKDFIKITGSKFYRLNCSTHQGNGVLPDIILPSYPAFSAYKENKEPFFLESDSVVKKVIFTPNPPINIAAVKSKSTERVAQSKDFKRYVQSADSITKLLNSNIKIPLRFADYKKYKEQNARLFDSFEKAMESNNTGLECVNNTFDKKLTEVSEQEKEFNQNILKATQKDIFINEAFLIMIDLLQTKQ